VKRLRLHQSFGVSRHALERYREHHPDATWLSLGDAVRAGVQLDPQLVATVTACQRRADGADAYVLAPDARGVFVIVRHPRLAVVTYLRLQASQRRHLVPAGRPLPVSGTTRHHLEELLEGLDEAELRFVDLAGEACVAREVLVEDGAVTVRLARASA
jgi:hypothetical protein